mmetsp:Transcript_37052/g.79808  ORF Transcript_37052/g.79808 Transcript_37052/m.79808 type:complete len:148 (-) Transcript_37052:1646-2089(-)
MGVACQCFEKLWQNPRLLISSGNMKASKVERLKAGVVEVNSVYHPDHPCPQVGLVRTIFPTFQFPWSWSFCSAPESCLFGSLPASNMIWTVSFASGARDPELKSSQLVQRVCTADLCSLALIQRFQCPGEKTSRARKVLCLLCWRWN